METAKAARPPPKVSRGSVYIFTLKADTAKMLREIAAEAVAAVDARGTSAVASARMAQARHTRKRAARAGTPRSTRRSDAHPPVKPPAMAKTGGIHAYQAACTSVRWWTPTR